jgi:Ras-related protein Rab-1A
MGCTGSAEKSSGTDYDHLFKLVLVGEVGVGKSSLVLRYTDNTFLNDDVGTIGADFKVKFINVDKKKIKLQIWDTAGQEKFRVMTSSYFGGANAVIIVFDLTDQKSLDAVEKWIKEAQSFADKSKPLQFLIVGNKKDLEKERTVDKDAPRKIAEKYNALYCETSAKVGTKVDEAFQMIAEHLQKDADDENNRLG